MDLNQIKKLIKIFEQSEITELEIEEGELKVYMSKEGNSNNVYYGQMPQHQMPVQQQPLPAVQQELPNSESGGSKSEEKPKDNFHEIKSPIVGTFYRAPAPDADPYVKVGDNVSSGTTLCIIEAMKLMNEIECDISGKIAKILVEDGTPVEYNQPLFLIET